MVVSAELFRVFGLGVVDDLGVKGYIDGACSLSYRFWSCWDGVSIEGVLAECASQCL